MSCHIQKGKDKKIFFCHQCDEMDVLRLAAKIAPPRVTPMLLLPKPVSDCSLPLF